MAEWAFITKHGVVLAHIAKHPRSTAREIALASTVTERTAHKIIADLEAGGYIDRQRVGRNNVYCINPDLGLRDEIAIDASVGDLLKVLGWRQHHRPSVDNRSDDSRC